MHHAEVAERPAVLSISDLAERTGVPQATLRSWETRYGFPAPARLPGGHRRYTEDDVDAVIRVVRHKSGGLALEAAVQRATAGAEPAEESIFGEVRRRHPDVVPRLVSKRTLLALSHAIEDECCANAHRGVLVGAFQRHRFLISSYARWVELARTARLALVFADLPQPAPVARRLPVEVAVPYASPLNREWVVGCDAPDQSACLVATERPGQEEVPDFERRFEAVWTTDPRVVRTVSRQAVRLARAHRSEVPDAVWPDLDDVPPAMSVDLRRATGLLERTVGYLDSMR